MSDDNDGFWDQRPSGPEVVRGRHRLPDPQTGEPRDWTRVTNFNRTYAESYGLDRWHLYQQLIGLSARPDLVARVQVLDVEDRRTMSEITDTALAVAGTDKAANMGNAVHRALELADLGAPYPAEYEPYVRAYWAELARHGLSVVPGMVEVTVLNVDLGVAGTGDRFLFDRAGRVVLGDIKSGRLDRAELEHRIQFACYATATHYRLRDGAWQPMPAGEHAVRDDVAVLIKVDLEQQSVSVYQVDLVAGRRSANLARQVREDRRLSGTLLPYVAPPDPSTALAPAQAPWSGGAAHNPPPDPGSHAVSGGLAGSTPPDPDEAAVLAAYTAQNGQRHLSVVPPAGFTVGADQVMPVLPTSPPLAVDPMAGRPGEHPRATDGPAPGQCGRCGQVQKTRAELKKLDKAGLQALCKAHDVTGNLAKNKDPLIDYLRDAGHVAGETPGAVGVPVQAPRLDDPQEITGPIGGSDPTDPRTDAFRALRLQRIAKAETINELSAVWAEVTRLGGQQAWTPDLDAATKARAAVIEAPTDGPAYRAATGQSQEPASPVAIAGPLALIQAVDRPEGLSQVWQTVTLGGTQPEHWTEEIGRAAQARLAELTSRPPTPAVNPFAQTPGTTP